MHLTGYSGLRPLPPAGDAERYVLCFSRYVVVDRKILKRPFTLERPPDWICPECSIGVLRIDSQTFHHQERAESRDHSHDAWEPDWIRYSFCCMARCTNDKCTETVSLSGSGSVDWSVYENERGHLEEIYADHFSPKYFEPPLKIIALPEECPDSVSEQVVESFRLVFASPSAAANSIRVAVEQLLTELKIKRFNVVNGKRRYISLHQRIDLLPSKYSELKDIILAIKWLGNTGSHSRGAITFDDVMDAYEFLEHILVEIYAQKSKKLKARAKTVNKKKGPAK